MDVPGGEREYHQRLPSGEIDEVFKVTLWLQILDTTPGHWCDQCSLPSARQRRLAVGCGEGLDTVVLGHLVVTLCMDCGLLTRKAEKGWGDGPE